VLQAADAAPAKRKGKGAAKPPRQAPGSFRDRAADSADTVDRIVSAYEVGCHLCTFEFCLCGLQAASCAPAGRRLFHASAGSVRQTAG
jgi:hypothetical protein